MTTAENTTVEPIDPSTVIIPPTIIGKYVEYLQYLFPDRPIPQHPDNKLFKAVSKAAHLIHDYYIIDRWIFQIKDNQVVDVLLVPSISSHARKRLEERFGLTGLFFNLRIAFEVASGEALSKKNRRRQRIEPGVMAIQFTDRLYLISEQYFRLITVIKLREKL